MPKTIINYQLILQDDPEILQQVLEEEAERQKKKHILLKFFNKIFSIIKYKMFIIEFVKNKAEYEIKETYYDRTGN